jgi:hypothetical protein
MTLQDCRLVPAALDERWDTLVRRSEQTSV